MNLPCVFVVAVDYLRDCRPLRLSVLQEWALPYHHGRVTDLLGEIPRQERTNYDLCGLEAMIDAASRRSRQRGVHFARIHRELFFHA